MRVQPRPLITLGLAVVYMAIVGITWAVVGLNYDEVGDSTSTVVKGIVIPIALGAVFLAIATSYLGWWRPAVHETMRAPKWLWAVPVLMAIPGLGSLLGGAPTADRSLGYLAALAVGTLFVGFSEEMLTRGTGLVGLRGGFKEPVAWALSCLLFGLIHALNAFFGQSIGSTIQQIVFAFLAGSVFYITRRVSGTLILCMVLHAWIDFTTLGFSDAAVDAKSPFTIVGFLQWGAFALALVGVFIVLRRGSSDETQTAGAHAAA
ncbi:MAG TPA: CPBP family intramembrane glutamic endopeptidase [Ornithinibacter sp.]|nr:CPBP family intramembrane glutamic endopeptidase [Ornithinibacter sp.]